MTFVVLELTVRATLLALGTAATLWLLQARAAAVRHAGWTVVVVAMLVLPPWLAAGTTVSVPLLPASTVAGGGGPASGDDRSPASARTPLDRVDRGVAAANDADARAAGALFGWPAILVGAYVAGLLAMLVRLAIGSLQAIALRRGAQRRGGRLTSRRCVTPVTVGWLRPALILPDDWERWRPAQLDAVLTHEQAHARRRDPLVQWLALLNRAVFWFHPLAWWLERRLAALAEEACDAAVLAAGHSPQDYSRYLLEMARAVRRRGGRLQLVGMAMPGTGLPRRLQRIFDQQPARSSRARVIGTVVLCAISSAVFAVGSLTPAGSPSQNAPAERRRYDAATVKPCQAEERPTGARGTFGGTNASVSPGRFSVPCVTAGQLIYLAYAAAGAREDERLINDDPGTAASPQKVRGGPDWVHSPRDKYAVEATAPGESERTVLMGVMLRTLLEERFRLKLHRETEEVPMLAMTVSKAGLKVKPMKEGDCAPYDGSTIDFNATKPTCGNLTMVGVDGHTRWTFGGFTLRSLAMSVSRALGLHVIDRTGIAGEFIMQLDFRREPRPGENAAREASGRDAVSALGDAPPLATALEDQLGLKLESVRGPRGYLVIDRIERPSPDSIPPARAMGAGR